MTHKLYELLNKLERDGVSFVIGRHRDDTVLVTCTFVGSRIEIDVFADGHVEFSVFSGDESVESSESELWKSISAATS
jgi:hypothetical protein